MLEKMWWSFAFWLPKLMNCNVSVIACLMKIVCSYYFLLCHSVVLLRFCFVFTRWRHAAGARAALHQELENREPNREARILALNRNPAVAVAVVAAQTRNKLFRAERCSGCKHRVQVYLRTTLRDEAAGFESDWRCLGEHIPSSLSLCLCVSVCVETFNVD